MSFAGRLARGVASGLAGYYGKLADQELEDRKQAATLDREKALATFQSGLRREETAAAGDESRRTYEANKTVDVAGELAMTPVKRDAQIAVKEAEERATLRRELTVAGVKFNQDMTLAQLRETAATHRTEIEQAGQNARSAADRDNRPAGTGVDSQGNLVIVKNNDTIVTAHGVRPTPRGTKASDDDLLGLGGDDTGGTGIAPRRAAAPAAAPRPATANVDTGPDSRFRTLYANSTPDRAPGLFRGGQRIPMDEAWRIYQAAQ
jgi:hypothetical protein